MRDSFRGYYQPSESELTVLWTEGDLILDTNALLHLFRYTEATRNDFLNALVNRRENLWIPHQVGLEFQRRRLQVIFEQGQAFDNLDKALETIRANISQTLSPYKRHPSQELEQIAVSLEASVTAAIDQVSTARESHGAYEDVVGGIFDKITELFEGRVGKPFNAAELEKHHELADERYESNIPPGFKDVQKDGDGKYGDYILWMQILNRAAETKNPAIFVTDDKKPDWWYKVSGRIQGPRVELVDEYFERAGARVHFYTPERFLHYAKSAGISVSTSSLTEVERVSSARSTRASSLLVARRNQLLADRARYEGSLRLARSKADEHNVEGSLRPDEIRERTRALTTELEQLDRTIDATESRPIGGLSRESLKMFDDAQARRRQVIREMSLLNNRLRRSPEREEQFYASRLAAIMDEIAQITEALAEIESGDEDVRSILI